MGSLIPFPLLPPLVFYGCTPPLNNVKIIFWQRKYPHSQSTVFITNDWVMIVSHAFKNRCLLIKALKVSRISNAFKIRNVFILATVMRRRAWHCVTQGAGSGAETRLTAIKSSSYHRMSSFWTQYTFQSLFLKISIFKPWPQTQNQGALDWNSNAGGHHPPPTTFKHEGGVPQPTQRVRMVPSTCPPKKQEEGHGHAGLPGVDKNSQSLRST